MTESDIFSEITSSCLQSLDHSGIKIDEAGVRSFLRDLTQEEYEKYSLEHGFAFPLKYSDTLDELNFLSVLTILNFLSGYRIVLHERAGQGAYDTIRRFALACYLSQDEQPSHLSAKGMADLSESKTSELLGLPILVEKDHPTLPVKIGERDSEAVEIVGLVKGVMNETGKILLSQKKASLGAFIVDFLNTTSDMNGRQRASALVQTLAATFPAFADECSVKGHTVKVYKKAQLLAYIVGANFKGREDVPFPLPTLEAITACVDNVLPTMAVHFKLVDMRDCQYPVYSNGLGSASASDKKVEGIQQTHEEAFAIRAATLAAIERTVELASDVAEETGKTWLKDITSMGLDALLWAGAKRQHLRNLPRLAERGTVFY